MAIDFPPNPQVGNTYTYLGVTYTWLEGGYWAVNAANSVSKADQEETREGVDDYKYITPFALEGRQATQTQTGMTRFSTNSETQSGTLDNVAVTPVSLAARNSTTTRPGLVTTATQQEVYDAVNNTKMVTPGTLINAMRYGPHHQSNESVRGTIEIASTAEVNAGSDHTRAVTPAGLATSKYNTNYTVIDTGTFSSQQRKVYANPFAGSPCICEFEVFYNGSWGKAHHQSWGIVDLGSFSTGATVSTWNNSSQIVVQAGNYALTNSWYQGNPFGITGSGLISWGSISTRVKIFRINGSGAL